MSFTKAKEGEYLNVFTNIGDRSFDFQCKAIEETESGFILKDCKNHGDVLVNYAPVLVTHSPITKGIGGGLVD